MRNSCCAYISRLHGLALVSYFYKGHALFPNNPVELDSQTRQVPVGLEREQPLSTASVLCVPVVPCRGADVVALVPKI